MTVIPLKGGPELLDFLGAFPDGLRNRAVRSAIVAAAAPVRAQARVLAPKKTGLMARAIQTGSARVNDDGTVSVRIRMASERSGKGHNYHAFLGYFWEYGTKAYSGKVIVRAGRSRQRSRKFHESLSGNIWGMYPDIAAHPKRPFMAPALEQRASEAVNAFGDRVRTYISTKANFTAPVTIEADGE